MKPGFRLIESDFLEYIGSDQESGTKDNVIA